jgi:hypothetical protein
MEQHSRLDGAQRDKLIVVLGMHRSGTSAMTRALVALGAQLGSRLLGPIPGNNDKGFFEDVDVLQINIELLAAAGADWHTVGSIDLTRVDPFALVRLQQHAVKKLREKCSGGIFALKDPRICRLLPFWQPAFEAAGLDVRYVISVRNPISVAQSLNKRDRFSEVKSYLLWLMHVVPALVHTRNNARVLVDYDRLLDDPATQLRRMASQLRLSIDDEQVEAFHKEFVEENLRHTRFDAQDVNSARSAPSALKRLFAELDHACLTGEPGREFEDAVQAGQRFLADIEPVLRDEVRMQRQIEQQNAAIAQRDQQLKALKETLAGRDRRIGELERTATAAYGKATAQSEQRSAAGAAGDPAQAVLPAEAQSERRVIFSLIVDAAAQFAYEGYHLVRSLIEHSSDRASDIHVQFTPEVSKQTRDLFGKLGCTLHEIQRFGDGRYCNKLAQLGNLHDFDFTHVVLLDTDMIAVDDLRPYLTDDALTAKIVDLPRPPMDVLAEIGRLAGLQALSQPVPADAVQAQTYAANCNGGFYGIPKALARRVDEQWRRWALWLLENMEPLTRGGNGHQNHVDQVALWLAILADGIPFRAAPSNVNYYVHFDGAHQYFDHRFGIALLHYHDVSLGVLGKLEPPARLDALARAAVAKANEQIGRGFENTTFWNFRYARFPERGSGLGSREQNLLYKRNLLVQNGIEEYSNVLDVGCGDLQILKELTIRDYLGIDVSHEALQKARRERPDWTFVHADDAQVRDLEPRDLALCFEVLIHQPNEADYRNLIDFLASSTKRTLLVSGYVQDYSERRTNSMVHFYEPLTQSLEKTGKFSSIRQIGAHSDVVVLRCDV